MKGPANISWGATRWPRRIDAAQRRRPEAPASGQAESGEACLNCISVLEHAALQRGRIVFDHPDIGRGRAVRARQGVGVERRAGGGAGLAGELLDEPRIGDVFEKQRLDALAADLPDQSGDRLCRGLAVGVDPFRREKSDAIGLAVIGKGIVGGDHPALCLRGSTPIRRGRAVERLELGLVMLEPLPVGLGMGWIGGGQGSRDIVGIDDDIARVLPGMRVGRRARRCRARPSSAGRCPRWRR